MVFKNSSIEANLTWAKALARQMQEEWICWKGGKNENIKSQCLSKYSAAYTSCKAYLENYLKHLYPNEKVPSKVSQDIRNTAMDMGRIEEMNEVTMQKVFNISISCLETLLKSSG